MNAPVLAILDSDLKAPQPALHKAQQIADASQRPLHVLVNAYSSAMVRAVGIDQERQNAARQQIHGAWEKRIRHLTDRDDGELSILWQKDSMEALRDSIIALQPGMVVVHTSAETGLRRHLFTPPGLAADPQGTLSGAVRPWSCLVLIAEGAGCP